MRESALWLAMALLAAFSVAGQAQEIGRNVVVRDAVAGDLYAAGESIEVSAVVAGDLVAAGRRVTVAGEVAEDLIAAGDTVALSGRVADDARLAGADVSITGSVAGHAALAGGEVRLGSGSRIDEWAWIAGGRVVAAGRIGGELKAAGGSIEIAGVVHGDVDLAAPEIRIVDGAVIEGDLVWRSESEPQISDGAVIRGQVRQGPGFDRPPERDGFVDRLLPMLSLIVAAGLFFTLFPKLCANCVDWVRERPWRSPLIGLAVLAATPLLALLLMITVIGALPGIVVLLAYGLLLALGGLAGVVVIARLGLRTWRREPGPAIGLSWLAIAVVTLILTLLYIVPLIGAAVATVVLLFGLGALCQELWTRLRA